MTEIEALSESAIVVMAGLRDASAHRYEPTAGNPDGRHTMFSITDLAAEGLVLGGDTGNLSGIAGLDKTARGLYKRHLVSRRTLHGRAYYALTDEGTVLMLRVEAEAGVTELAEAERAMCQAQADAELAVRREREARAALTAARRRHGGRYALEVLLDARREYPLGARRGEGNA